MIQFSGFNDTNKLIYPGDNFTFLVSNFYRGWFRGNTKIEGGAGGSTNMTSFPRFLGWWGIRNFILFGKISSWSHEPNGGIMSWRLDRRRKQATRKSEGEDKSWKNYWRKPRRKYKQKRNSFIMSHLAEMTAKRMTAVFFILPSEDEMAQLQKDIDAERKKAMKICIMSPKISQILCLESMILLLLFFPLPSLWTWAIGWNKWATTPSGKLKVKLGLDGFFECNLNPRTPRRRSSRRSKRPTKGFYVVENAGNCNYMLKNWILYFGWSGEQTFRMEGMMEWME